MARSSPASSKAMRHLSAGLPLIAFVVLGHLGLSSMVRAHTRTRTHAHMHACTHARLRGRGRARQTNDRHN